jgi:uracil-DNA glycosylase
VKTVAIPPTFPAWQAAARELLRKEIPPSAVLWAEAPAPSLGAAAPEQALPDEAAEPSSERPPRVPRAFLDLAREVARHRDPARWELLYAVLWRLVHEDRNLLAAEVDAQVATLVRMRGEVRRAAEGMTPPAVAGPGQSRPARASRRSAVPVGAHVARDLFGTASAGEEPDLGRPPGARQWVPADATLHAFRAAAPHCRGCDLYRHARQVVFGVGPDSARVVLVGEQPGDQEDRQGKPFVGPAGEVLDRALAEAGIARERLYVTNVVKHFKFVVRGGRRLHQTPSPAEVGACLPWLEAEIEALRPEVVVCLGATAARALLGGEFRLLRQRGLVLATRWAPQTLATLHPSAVLRGVDEAEQERLYAMLLSDLRVVSSLAPGA